MEASSHCGLTDDGLKLGAEIAQKIALAGKNELAELIKAKPPRVVAFLVENYFSKSPSFLGSAPHFSGLTGESHSSSTPFLGAFGLTFSQLWNTLNVFPVPPLHKYSWNFRSRTSFRSPGGESRVPSKPQPV